MASSYSTWQVGRPRRRTSSSMQGRSSWNQRMGMDQLDRTGHDGEVAVSAALTSPAAWTRRTDRLPPQGGMAHGRGAGRACRSRGGKAGGEAGFDGLLGGGHPGGKGQPGQSRLREGSKSSPTVLDDTQLGFGDIQLAWQCFMSSMPGGTRRWTPSSSAAGFHALDDGFEFSQYRLEFHVGDGG